MQSGNSMATSEKTAAKTQTPNHPYEQSDQTKKQEKIPFTSNPTHKKRHALPQNMHNTTNQNNTYKTRRQVSAGLPVKGHGFHLIPFRTQKLNRVPFPAVVWS